MTSLFIVIIFGFVQFFECDQNIFNDYVKLDYNLSNIALRPNIVEEVPTLDIGPLTTLTVVAGSVALLPCAHHPISSDDVVRLILWYRNDTSRPFMSFDARSSMEKTPEKGASPLFSSWKSPKFSLVSTGKTLVLRRTWSGDQVEYRCTLHYQKSPSVTRRIQLVLKERIPWLVLKDPSGRTVWDRIGPFSEGQRLHLTCTAKFNESLSAIEWLVEGKLASSSWSSPAYGVVISHLDLTLDKNHSENSLICRLITTKFNNTTNYKDAPECNITDISTTIVMNYIPEVRLLLESGVGDPSGQVPTLTRLSINEGQSVTLTCVVRSRPPSYNITWLHNGHVLTLGGRLWSRGSNSLVISLVGKADAGLFTCLASNREGDGHSNSVLIQVDYAPFCTNATRQRVVSARNSTVSLSCNMSAQPTNLTFTWTMQEASHIATDDSATQNAEEPSELAGESVSFHQDPTDHTRSTMTFFTEEDAIQVFCAARNSVGHSRIPCSYLVTVVEPPSPPEDCTVNVVENTRLIVTCDSHASDMPQDTPKQAPGISYVRSQELRTMSHLEVWEQDTLVANTSNKRPEFDIKGLPPDADIKMKIYSATQHAYSVPLILHARTGRRQHNHTDFLFGANEQVEVLQETPAIQDGVTYLLIMMSIGVGIAFVLLLGVGAGFIWWHRRGFIWRDRRKQKEGNDALVSPDVPLSHQACPAISLSVDTSIGLPTTSSSFCVDVHPESSLQLGLTGPV